MYPEARKAVRATEDQVTAAQDKVPVVLMTAHAPVTIRPRIPVHLLNQDLLQVHLHNLNLLRTLRRHLDSGQSLPRSKSRLNHNGSHRLSQNLLNRNGNPLLLLRNPSHQSRHHRSPLLKHQSQHRLRVLGRKLERRLGERRKSAKQRKKQGRGKRQQHSV